METRLKKPIWDINFRSTLSTISKVDEILSLLSSNRVTVFQFVFFSTRFQRARSCNDGIPRLSQNKMKRLYLFMKITQARSTHVNSTFQQLNSSLIRKRNVLNSCTKLKSCGCPVHYE